MPVRIRRRAIQDAGGLPWRAPLAALSVDVLQRNPNFNDMARLG